MPQPVSLEKLSLNAFGKYFYDLCLVLAPFSPPKSRGGKSKKKNSKTTPDEQKVKCIGKNLNSYLIKNVRTAVINTVTNELLIYLNIIIQSQTEGIACSLEQKRIYGELFKSILHPAVTRIDCTDYEIQCSNVFPSMRYVCGTMLDLIVKAITNLKKLKALHLYKGYGDCNLKNIEIPSELEEFSGLCDDAGLAKMANSCKNIKFLNVGMNSGITNASIDVILKMETLEKLNISDVRLSEKDMTNFLTDLVKKGDTCKLQFLTFSKFISEHLKILESLPNIRVCLDSGFCPLWLGAYMFKVPDFYNLRNLHGLSITCKFSELNDLVREIGNQLVYLHINTDDHHCNIDVKNLMMIGLHCTSLKCFHLRGKVNVSADIMTYPRRTLAGFYSVSCLILDVEARSKISSKVYYNNLLYFLISQCVNARKVTIPVDRCFINKHKLVSSLLEKNCLKNVKEVFFQPCSCECALENLDAYEERQEDDIFDMLKTKCPNIRLIKNRTVIVMTKPSYN